MDGLDALLEQGYTLKGMPRKRINTDTGETGYEETSTLGRIAQNISGFLLKQRQEEEKRQKEMNKKLEMYKTLREAGYDPGRAHKAVQEMKFPAEAAAESIKEQQAKAELEKTRVETEKIKKDMLTPSKGKGLQSRIMEKIANDEELTPGEQKIYDEVIKRSDTGDELADILKNKGQAGGGGDAKSQWRDDEMVPVISPEGKAGKIPRKNLTKALKAGYKLKKGGAHFGAGGLK